MITYNEAVENIKAAFGLLKPGSEEINLESALHRTLAQDVYADMDFPPFNCSAIDGIAIQFTPRITKWEIIGEISAGKFKNYPAGTGSAVIITTGSKMPTGYDTVIPLEDIDIYLNTATLKAEAKVRANKHIRHAACDIKTGDMAVLQNTVLQPRHLGVLAACGKVTVKVMRQLRISVLSTGDELVNIWEKPVEDKIRASNGAALCASIKNLRQLAYNMGFLKDDNLKIRDKFTSLLHDDSDIIITTGGISVGKYDLMREVFKKAGVEEVFWRVSVKPGKPVYVGVYGQNKNPRLIFGLPGNPVACQVAFEIFIRPFIENMYNHQLLRKVWVEMSCTIRKKDSKRHFIWGSINNIDSKLTAVPAESQSSGNQVGFGQSDCLIVFPENLSVIKKGQQAECILI